MPIYVSTLFLALVNRLLMLCKCTWVYCFNISLLFANFNFFQILPFQKLKKIFFWKFKKWKNLKFFSLHSKIRAKFIQDTQCIETEPKVRKLCLKDSTFEAIICHLLFQNLEILITSKILIFLHFKALKRSNTVNSVVFLHFGLKKVEKIQNLMQKNISFEKVNFFQFS